MEGHVEEEWRDVVIFRTVLAILGNGHPTNDIDPADGLPPNPMLSSLLLVPVVFVFAGQTDAQNLSDSLTQNVKARLAEGSTQSWEIGTRAQALLTHSNSRYSVYYTGDDLSAANNDSSRDGTFLPPPSNDANSDSGDLSTVLEIASSVVGNRSRTNGDISGPQPFMKDGSAADPASIGVAVLLANWTNAPSPQNTSTSYSQAAQDQLDYLLTSVPRSSEGAISHRVAQVQLWSDFVYMVPPFLAYYGVTTGNTTLIDEAYNQISLYRDQLRDGDADGLWKHILLGTGTGAGAPPNDEGHWSTGNAWAASGMLRVLSTMQHSPYASSYQHQMGDLQSWVFEIQSAMFGRLLELGLRDPLDGWYQSVNERTGDKLGCWPGQVDWELIDWFHWFWLLELELETEMEQELELELDE
ncbi:hypothetical protein D9758_010082 [Tetrapyrgos nigripes]|uniref:Six-hairpin glycosidase-like protein n=1 Tax=Tetrapyrgos nigripes TaxID=182062 RepID=A0A8H5FRZ9_9AGAR|nr:hypothetical protein D9758_010082 [Tetrapyrgos nigripes]